MSEEQEIIEVTNAIVERCQAGDRQAFKAIYEGFKMKVFATAYRFTNNHAEASDLTQDIFIGIFKKIRQFEFRSSFSTWVYRLSVNMCIDRIRKLKRYSISSMDHPDFTGTEDYKKIHNEHQMEKADDNLIKDEKAEKTKKAISKLTPKLKAIVILRYIQDLSYNEISKILKCSEGTVKSRLNRAHIKLKEIMIKL
ncbi:RNA polymerase sigma factor [Candidatus Auribacterota bacterium]